MSLARFNVVKKDKNSYAVSISDLNNQVITELPLDPVDNTLAAVLSADVIATLGSNADAILKDLSDYLQKEIGGKAFILIPDDKILPDFIPAESHAFKRVRHANRTDLANSSAAILAQHEKLVAELDAKYRVVLGIDKIISGIEDIIVEKEDVILDIKDVELAFGYIQKLLESGNTYSKLYKLLNEHADFLPSKMDEYKQEAKIRFHNSSVNTVALINKQNRELVGVIRCLDMGNGFGYLSDETIKQELISLDKFAGKDTEEQKKNRNIFLLAYLMNRSTALFKKQNHFLLIAANGREASYDTVGCKTFPINDCGYVATMKLAAPAPTLVAIKKDLLTPSNMAVVANMGLLPAPTSLPVTQHEEKAATKTFNKK